MISSMYMFAVMAIITIVCLVLLAKQDIREHMVYAFPVAMLHLMWCIFIWQAWEYESNFLAVYWMVHLMIYLFLNHFKVWGAGDSDFFLLFSDACLIGISVSNAYAFALVECLCLICALALSIGIGMLVARVRKEKLGRYSAIAVTPGISVISIALIIIGGIVRYTA